MFSVDSTTGIESLTLFVAEVLVLDLAKLCCRAVRFASVSGALPVLASFALFVDRFLSVGAILLLL